MLGKNLTRKVGIAAVAAAVTAVPVTALGTMNARAAASDSAKKLCSKTCAIKVDVGAGLVEGGKAKTEVKGADGQYKLRAFRVETKKGKKGSYALTPAGPVQSVTVKSGKASTGVKVDPIKAPDVAQKYAYVVQPADSSDAAHLVSNGGKDVSSFTVFSHRAAVTGKADNVPAPDKVLVTPKPHTPMPEKPVSKKPATTKAATKKAAPVESTVVQVDHKQTVKAGTIRQAGAVPAAIPAPKTCRPTGTVRPTVIPVKADAQNVSAKDSKAKSDIIRPTFNPTDIPCVSEKPEPTMPTLTVLPTQKPKPSEKPTVTPTQKPTGKPSQKPTRKPSEKPTVTPTRKPTAKPTKTVAPKPEKVSAFRLDNGIAGDAYAVDLKTSQGWKKVSLTHAGNGKIAKNHSGAVLWTPKLAGDLPAGKYPVRVYNTTDVAHPVFTTELTTGKVKPTTAPTTKAPTKAPSTTKAPTTAPTTKAPTTTPPTTAPSSDPTDPADPKDEPGQDPTDPAPVDPAPVDDAPAGNPPVDAPPVDSTDVPVGDAPIDGTDAGAGGADETSSDVVPASSESASSPRLSSLPSTGAGDLVVPGALALVALTGGAALLATRRRH